MYEEGEWGAGLDEESSGVRKLNQEGQWAAGLDHEVVSLVCCWLASKAEAPRREVAPIATVAAAATIAAFVLFSVEDVCRLEALIVLALDGALFRGFSEFMQQRGLKDFASFCATQLGSWKDPSKSEGAQPSDGTQPQAAA